MQFINHNLKITSFGGTHEKEVGVVIENFPADFEVDMDEIREMLDRRRPGQSELTTQRSETDEPEILSGIKNGKTTGEPIKVSFLNQDVKNAENDGDMIPRPGHGDFTYYMNSGEFKKGASSARFTVGLVFAGALAKQFLREKGIFVNSRLVRIGEKSVENQGEKLVDRDVENYLKSIMAEGDSIGGAVESLILGLPAGFGDIEGERLESRLSSCFFAVPGVKAVEIGLGVDSALLKGSEMNDAFVVENGKVRTKTNNCGGLLGGLATGMPIVVTSSFKPTPSIKKEQQSVKLDTLENVNIKCENRSDPCIAIRGTVCCEAAAAIAIMDLMI